MNTHDLQYQRTSPGDWLIEGYRATRHVRGRAKGHGAMWAIRREDHSLVGTVNTLADVFALISEIRLMEAERGYDPNTITQIPIQRSTP